MTPVNTRGPGRRVQSLPAPPFVPGFRVNATRRRVRVQGARPGARAQALEPEQPGGQALLRGFRQRVPQK